MCVCVVCGTGSEVCAGGMGRSVGYVQSGRSAMFRAASATIVSLRLCQRNVHERPAVTLRSTPSLTDSGRGRPGQG